MVCIVFLWGNAVSVRLLREMNSVFTLDLVWSFKFPQYARHCASVIWGSFKATINLGLSLEETTWEEKAQALQKYETSWKAGSATVVAQISAICRDGWNNC